MKKGFTLIELLAVIAILAIIVLIAIPYVISTIENSKQSAFTSSSKFFLKAVELEYAKNKTSGIEAPLSITFENGVLTSGSISYNGKTPENGTINVNINGQIETFLSDGKYCYKKAYTDINPIVFLIDDDNPCQLGPILYKDSTGANRPELLTGMIPIRWNGTNWVKADPTLAWFDYQNREWANAVFVTNASRTTYQNAANGTIVNENDILIYLVWIPRFAYQIATNYHYSNPGTMNIKFLKNTTNETIDSTPIALTPTYSGNSQTNYIKHSAFTFGTKELTGIWVSKFEVSNTFANLRVKPNQIALTGSQIGTFFQELFNLKTRIEYGFNQTEIDTHMIKNVEWGAVAYLSQSSYGTIASYINGANNRMTGCGSFNTADLTNACLYSYTTTEGRGASTTNTVYGIYDMKGGSFEYTAAYLNNGNSNLATHGASLVAADPKYKDIYVNAVTDNSENNYAANATKKGDAFYETSWIGTGASSWYSDHSGTPNTAATFFLRGGYYANGIYAGLFSFSSNAGSGDINTTSRVVFVKN